MNLFNFMRRASSAPVARERLQILLEYERRMVSKSDLVAVLRQEILAVISRHVAVDPDKVQVKIDRGSCVSLLEVDVEFPNSSAARA
ncbi:MAG TPA: cell division topological specificity factor MinE [Xanthobacteraceae bacterium]|nr:cell division topological specificity factor MinE [Xanthobacteraceae bacterium]